MKKFLEIILAAYARLALAIHKPKVIGITGSVGKSSTKEAVALVLRTKFRVGSNPGNLNSQLGLPLAVLGFKSSGGFKKNLASVFDWIWIIVSGLFRIFRFNFPKILVLEMGSDKPGDIAYLLSIVGKLDLAIITDIGISHMQFFSSPEALQREKLSLLKGLSKIGVAVLNADNPKVLAGKPSVKGSVITYGFQEADVQAQDFQVTNKNDKSGVGMKVVYKGNRVPFFLPDTIGKPAAYAALAATAVALSQGMNLVEISQALEHYKQPAGRLKLLEGINQSTIIDDTYNSAPASTIAALEALQDIPGSRKLAAIGHMAELGSLSEAGHREVAAKIVECGLNTVYLVGDKTRDIEDELAKRKFSGKVIWFTDSDAAKASVAESLYPGDVILVKGSQAARMEKVVKEILAHPEQAKNLLVRQSKQWI